MIRTILAICLFTYAFVAPTRANAQVVDPPIVVRDPGVYAQTFADSMALSGVRPLREAFAQLLGLEVAMPADVDASLRVYENPEMVKPALVSRVIEDVALSDTYRVIYLYHYYGGNFWVFTRLEFVRVSTTEWTLSRLAFADRWVNVIVPTTPGFESSIRQRAGRNRR